MAGCYGGSPEDRYFERMLYDYLDSLDVPEDEEDIIEDDEPEEKEEEKDVASYSISDQWQFLWSWYLP